MTTRFSLDNLCQSVGGIWLRRASSASCSGVAIDSRQDVTGSAFFAIRGNVYDGHDYVAAAAQRGATAVVVDRPIDLDSISHSVGILRVGCTRKALGAFAHAHRASLMKTAVIAITGTCGKTMTKEMIHGVLSMQLVGTRAIKSFNNDIGVPLTLLDASDAHDYVVVEIGTNAPGEIAALGEIAQPDIAVITMVGRGHLEKLGSVEGVVREKVSLLEHVRSGGAMIVNGDQPLLQRATSRFHPVITFGSSPGVQLRMTQYAADAASCTFEVNGSQRYTLPIVGRHFAQNALAAIAVGQQMGLDGAAIAEGLLRCATAPMRSETLQCGSVIIVNDAYNANPESMLASVETFLEQHDAASRRVMILGDMLELGSHSNALHRELGDSLASSPGVQSTDLLIFIGREMRACADRLVNRASPHAAQFDTLNDSTMREITALLCDDDVVLLKGSRAIALERLLPELRTRFQHNDPSAIAANVEQPLAMQKN